MFSRIIVKRKQKPLGINRLLFSLYIPFFANAIKFYPKIISLHEPHTYLNKKIDHVVNKPT